MGILLFSGALGCARHEQPHTHVMVLVPSIVDVPPALGVAEFERVLRRAASKWSYPLITCSSLRIEVARPDRIRRTVEDGRSVVVFRAARWCHDERCGARDTFPVAAAAMTSAYPQAAGPGHTTEADIELNAVNYGWKSAGRSGVDRGTHTYQAALEAVLLHEIGHAVGFHDEQATDGVMHASEALELSPSDVSAVCRAFPR